MDVEPFETVFLRAFADAYVSEIKFLTSVEREMLSLRTRGYTIGLADVIHVLKNGEVTRSEKNSADGAEWEVTGETCHDYEMVVKLNVWCDHYKVRVTDVAISGVRDA